MKPAIASEHSVDANEIYKSRHVDSEIISVDSEYLNGSTTETECDKPDRGLRAWLVVLGASARIIRVLYILPAKSVPLSLS